MAYELRPYQQDALNSILEDVRESQCVLLQAGCGAGKTIITAALIKHCMEKYKMRIGFLAHREQLIRQTKDKLLKVWPEGEQAIGIACSSVSSEVELERPVIIGSPQTLARRLDEMPPLQMLIVDECHRLPPANVQSQYGNLITKLKDRYPQLRLVGVTATPYRLGHGYIYGDQCKAGEENWFDDLSYQISIQQLIGDGYLTPYKAYAADTPDLTGVRKSGGEFVLGDLGETMSSALHLESAVKAIEDYASDREHIVVFAVTIEHAEALKEAFLDAGHSCVSVHSKMPHDIRMANLEAFDKGKVRVICNVGILTEGWDSTGVDCMVMCRPTMSPSLYVQMVGRGLRTHEGKEDCLILDLSGNWLRHGDPNEPIVTWSRPSTKGEKVEPSEPQGVECPKCKCLVTSRTIVCPECGEELKEVRNERLELHEVETVVKPVNPFGLREAHVCSSLFEPYTSRRGNRMLRLVLYCLGEGETIPKTVYDYWDLEGQGSDFGMRTAREKWRDMSITHADPPDTINEAMGRLNELQVPNTVWLELQGKYLNVKRWGE